MSTVSECDVVAFTQWSGSASKRNIELNQPVNQVVVQHTVTNECFSDADCERIAKGIRAYQMKELKYDDIGLS